MRRVDHPYHPHMEEEVERLRFNSLHLLGMAPPLHKPCPPGSRREVVPYRTIRLVVEAAVVEWRHHRPLVVASSNNNNSNSKGAPTITAIRARNLVPFGLKELAEMVTTVNLLMKDHLAAEAVVEERASIKTATTAIRARDLVPFGLKELAEMVTIVNLLMKDHLAVEAVLEEEQASIKAATAALSVGRVVAATLCRMLLRLEATLTTWEVPNRLPTTAHLVLINPMQQHLLLEPGLLIPIRLQAPSADLHLVRKEGLGRQHRVHRLSVVLQAAALVAGLQLRHLLEGLQHQLHHLLEVLQHQLRRLLEGLQHQLHHLLEGRQHQLHRLLEVLLQQLHHPLVVLLKRLHRLLVVRHPLHRLLGDLPAVALAETPRMLLPLVEVAETKTLRSGKTRELRLLVTQRRLRLHLEAIKILAVAEEAEATSKAVLEETTKTHHLEEVGTPLAINDQAVVRSLALFGLKAVADTVTTANFLTRDPPEEVVVVEEILVSVVVAVVAAVAVVISRLVAVAVVSVGTTTHPLAGQDDKRRATLELCSLMGHTHHQKRCYQFSVALTYLKLASLN